MSRTRQPSRRVRMRLGIPAVVAVLVMVLAGCSGSKSASSNKPAPSGASAGSASAASGSPIYVGTECSVTPPQDMSECSTVPQAYFDQINAQGGVNGHPVKLVTCNSSAQPTNMSYCLQSLMADSRVMAILDDGGTGLNRFDTGSNAVATLATQTVAVDDLTSPYAFPVSSFSEAGGSLGALARYGLTQGYKNPVLLECEYQACSDVSDSMTKIYAGTGTSFKAIVAPIAAPNFTTYLAAAQHANSGLVMIAETSADDASMVKTALDLDYHPVFGWTFSCYDQPAIDSVKGVTATILCPQPFKSWTEAGSQLEATMKQYGPSKWTWNTIAVLGWIGAHMFVDAAKTITGPITRQSFLASMNHLTNFTNEFLAAPIDFSKPGPSADAPRIPNFLWYIYKVNNGTLEPVTPTAIEVPPVIG